VDGKNLKFLERKYANIIIKMCVVRIYGGRKIYNKDIFAGK